MGPFKVFFSFFFHCKILHRMGDVDGPHLIQLLRRMLQSCVAVNSRNVLWIAKLHMTFHPSP